MGTGPAGEGRSRWRLTAMKSVDYIFQGQTYPLCLNGAALFAIYDKYGADISVFEPITPTDNKGFEAVCFYLHKLAEQGELVRRWEGHRPRKIPAEKMFAALLSPLDVPEAKTAIRQAIRLGFEREHDDRESIDLGLAELRKKEAAD